MWSIDWSITFLLDHVTGSLALGLCCAYAYIFPELLLCLWSAVISCGHQKLSSSRPSFRFQELLLYSAVVQRYCCCYHLHFKSWLLLDARLSEAVTMAPSLLHSMGYYIMLLDIRKGSPSLDILPSSNFTCPKDQPNLLETVHGVIRSISSKVCSRVCSNVTCAGVFQDSIIISTRW